MQFRLTLDRLPSDVLREIAYWLCPTDLSRLALLNVALNLQVFNDRSIWYDQIRWMIRNRCLPPNSLRLTGLLPSSLRQIATRPYRLLRAIETKHGKVKTLYPDLQLVPSGVSYLHGIPSLSKIVFATVLPGSKWLLVGVGNVETSELRCWDLEYLNKGPATYALRKPFSIFEGLESSPVILAQYNQFGVPSVNVMVLTCDHDGEYDIEILSLYWESAQSGDGDEPGAMFAPLARLTPGNIYVQYAFLDGDYVYAGSQDIWIVWNWRRDEILNLSLECSDVVHAVLLSPHLTTVSRFGVLYVYWIPPTQPRQDDSPRVPVKALAKSVPYGTVRSITTLQSWIPQDMRESTKISLKTTVISGGQSQRKSRLESKIVSFTITFECPFNRHDPLTSEAHNPELLLPRLIYRGPGSFDWNPTYTLSDDVLMEISLTNERIPLSPSLRLYPTLMFECHTLGVIVDSSRSYSRCNPIGGRLILESVFDHGRATANGIAKDTVSLCFVTGRVVIITPHTRSIETFQFE